ncbi:MAG: magnesium transporter [Burkholderiales bacterium]|nr:magnesium transporter [Burkholderiales bacterium]
MAEPDILSNAFLASHPDAAARVLEQLPHEDAAALFERVPARLGAGVLNAMLPYTAARCLQLVEAPRAAMLLAAISVPAASAVLRNVPEAQRTRVLDLLPTATALACRALLGYPEDSVGACVDTEIIALRPGSRASEALDALRTARSVPAGPVYVVDALRRPLGQIGLPELMRADAQQRLDALMVPVPATLPAVTPLAGAQGHPAWRDVDVVPVVERGGGLVGVVLRHALRRAQRSRSASIAPAPEALAALLALSYWNAVVGLVEATLSVVLPARRERP